MKAQRKVKYQITTFYCKTQKGKSQSSHSHKSHQFNGNFSIKNWITWVSYIRLSSIKIAKYETHIAFFLRRLNNPFVYSFFFLFDVLFYTAKTIINSFITSNICKWCKHARMYGPAVCNVGEKTLNIRYFGG